MQQAFRPEHPLDESVAKFHSVHGRLPDGLTVRQLDELYDAAPCGSRLETAIGAALEYHCGSIENRPSLRYGRRN